MQAVGCQARFIKIGAPCRAERVSKLNRLLEIESQLSSRGRLQADNEHVFISLSIPPTPPQSDDAVVATTPVPDKQTSGKHK